MKGLLGGRKSDKKSLRKKVPFMQQYNKMIRFFDKKGRKKL